MTVPRHLEAGREAEDQAAEYLAGQGLELLARNFRCRAGEIDLIMRDGSTLVFVEVRLRRDERFGGALHSVTPAKQRKLQRAAAAFLARHGAGRATCRFDVLSVTQRNYRPQFVWVRNAFGQDN